MGVLSVSSGKEFLHLVNHDNASFSGLPEDIKGPIMNSHLCSLLYFKV